MGCSYKKENNGEINIIVKQREKTMSHNFTKRYMTCEARLYQKNTKKNRCIMVENLLEIFINYTKILDLVNNES